MSTYAARAAAVLSLVVLFPFIVRYVGLEEYGIWLLISSFTWLFMSDLGIGTAAARYVAEASVHEDWDLGSRTLTTALVCFAGVGATALIVFGGITAFAWESLNIPDGQRGLAALMVVVAGVGYLLLGLPLSLFRSVLAGLQRYDVANKVQVVQSILRVAITITALLAGAGVLAVVLIDVGLMLAAGLAMLVATRRISPALVIDRGRFDWGLARSVAPYSLQVFVLGVAGLVILQADNLVIGLFLPVAAVALYSGAFRIYQLCREVTGSLMIPIVPDAAQAGTLGDTERLRNLLLHGTRVANGALCAVAVPAAVMAGPLLALWAGPSFRSVAVVTQILIAGLLINNCHLIALPIMVGLGEVRRYAALHAAWALSNVVLSVALIGPFGLRGVALGTALPMVVLEPMYIQAAVRHLGVHPRDFWRHAILRGFGPAILPAIGFAGVVAVNDPTSWVAVTLLGTGWCVAYGYAFWALCLGDGDRVTLRRTLRSRIVPIAMPGGAA